MGMGHIEVELMIHEHSFRPIEGEVLAIGRQHISPTAEHILDMLRRYNVPVLSSTFEAADKEQHGPHGAVSDTSLFRSFTTARYLTADISPYEGAEFIFDICGEVPPELIGRFDFIIDGGSLDNVFDPLRMLVNMTRMLKPGGRMLVFAWSNTFPSAYVKITPDWLMDFFSVNEFADAKLYVSHCESPGGEPHIGQSVELFHFDPYLEEAGGAYEAANVRIAGYSSTYAIAEKGQSTTAHRTAVQKHYRGTDIEPYLTSARRFHKSGRPIFARPGEAAPDAYPISDMVTVRPVARFGTPGNLSESQIIMRRLDRLASEIQQVRAMAPVQIYSMQQLLAKQIAEMHQALNASIEAARLAQDRSREPF